MNELSTLKIQLKYGTGLSWGKNKMSGHLMHAEIAEGMKPSLINNNELLNNEAKRKSKRRVLKYNSIVKNREVYCTSRRETERQKRRLISTGLLLPERDNPVFFSAG